MTLEKRCSDCKYVTRCENPEKLENKMYISACVRYRCYESLDRITKDAIRFGIKIKIRKEKGEEEHVD